jgi:hypothetical protein
VEVYKSETREVINRFLAGRLSFPNCIAALDAALAGVLPKLTAEQLDPLRALMLANNEIVMKEMERRASAAQVAEARPRGSGLDMPC